MLYFFYPGLSVDTASACLPVSFELSCGFCLLPLSLVLNLNDAFFFRSSEDRRSGGALARHKDHTLCVCVCVCVLCPERNV